MVMRRPLGFGSTEQVAEFFGLPETDVERLAESGRWPNYVIAGRRVFNLDELVELVARESTASPGVEP